MNEIHVVSRSRKRAVKQRSVVDDAVVGREDAVGDRVRVVVRERRLHRQQRRHERVLAQAPSAVAVAVAQRASQLVLARAKHALQHCERSRRKRQGSRRRRVTPIDSSVGVCVGREIADASAVVASDGRRRVLLVSFVVIVFVIRLRAIAQTAVARGVSVRSDSQRRQLEHAIAESLSVHEAAAASAAKALHDLVAIALSELHVERRACRRDVLDRHRARRRRHLAQHAAQRDAAPQTHQQLLVGATTTTATATQLCGERVAKVLVAKAWRAVGVVHVGVVELKAAAKRDPLLRVERRRRDAEARQQPRELLGRKRSRARRVHRAALAAHVERRVALAMLRHERRHETQHGARVREREPLGQRLAERERLAIGLEQLQSLVRRERERHDGAHKEVARAVEGGGAAAVVVVVLRRHRATKAPAIEEAAAGDARVLDARLKDRERVVLEEVREHKLARGVHVVLAARRQRVEASAEAQLLARQRLSVWRHRHHRVAFFMLSTAAAAADDARGHGRGVVRLEELLPCALLLRLPLARALRGRFFLRDAPFLRDAVRLEVVVARERVAVLEQKAPRRELHDVAAPQVARLEPAITTGGLGHLAAREQHGKVAAALALALGLDDLERVVAQVKVQHVPPRLGVQRVRVAPRHEEAQHLLTVRVELAHCLALRRLLLLLLRVARGEQSLPQRVQLVRGRRRVVRVPPRRALLDAQRLGVERAGRGVAVDDVERAAEQRDAAADRKVLGREAVAVGFRDGGRAAQELALRESAVGDARLRDRERAVAQVQQQHDAPHARAVLKVGEEAQHDALVRDPRGLRRVHAVLGALDDARLAGSMGGLGGRGRGTEIGP